LLRDRAPPLRIAVGAEQAEHELRPRYGEVLMRRLDDGRLAVRRKSAGKKALPRGTLRMAFADGPRGAMVELSSNKGHDFFLPRGAIVYPDIAATEISGSADGVTGRAADLALVLRRSDEWSCALPPAIHIEAHPPASGPPAVESASDGDVEGGMVKEAQAAPPAAPAPMLSHLAQALWRSLLLHRLGRAQYVPSGEDDRLDFLVVRLTALSNEGAQGAICLREIMRAL